MLAFRRTAVILALLILSSCAFALGKNSFFWGMCEDEAKKFVTNVNWDLAEKIDIRIRQDEFSPTYLGLYMRRPYVLRIENADDFNHTFRAIDFFRAVAVSGISANGVEYRSVGCLDGVTIPPNSQIYLRFVAVRDGTYEFDDNSLMISLALIGSGGGFITIEPPMTIIQSPIKHLNLFKDKSAYFESGSIRTNGTSFNDVVTGSTIKKQDEKKKARSSSQSKKLNQAKKVAPKVAEKKNLIKSSDTNSTSPSTVSSGKNSKALKNEKNSYADKKKSISKKSSLTMKRNTNLDAKIKSKAKNQNLKTITNLPKPVMPVQKFEEFGNGNGPPADVYSDPPVELRIEPGSDGDSGEDRLEGSEKNDFG